MTTILIVLALFIAANFVLIYVQNAKTPTLGVDNGQLTPVSKKPNNVSSQATDSAKVVAPLAFKETPEATIAALKKAVENYGGATLKSESEDYLYFVFTTSLMKYNDDVEFWLDTDAKQVHFRSASRAGHSDMGLNRTRYDAIAELYSNL
jgi:uncharacterized protein (DUF1499 family)